MNGVIFQNKALGKLTPKRTTTHHDTMERVDGSI